MPLLGPYGEAMAAMLSGAPALAPTLWLPGHAAAALLLCWYYGRQMFTRSARALDQMEPPVEHS